MDMKCFYSTRRKLICGDESLGDNNNNKQISIEVFGYYDLNKILNYIDLKSLTVKDITDIPQNKYNIKLSSNFGNNITFVCDKVDDNTYGNCVIQEIL